MNTIVYNIEIKDTDKENGKLKDSFVLNAEVNFMKTILDRVKNGEDITIHKLLFSERLIETVENVEVVDTDKKTKKILQDKVKKVCYSCVGLIDIHKHVEGIRTVITKDTSHGITSKDTKIIRRR